MTDGTTQIVETDQEDDAASLTQEDIARIFDAALADTNGTIVSISAEDEDGEDRDAYGVEVLSSDGTQVVELELDINYSVIDREVEGVAGFPRLNASEPRCGRVAYATRPSVFIGSPAQGSR